VEDELIIAEGILRMLDEIGYEVAEPVTSYDDAIRMIKEEKPDLLILDINISGNKSGIDIANTVRKDFNVPFIFLTANSDKQTLSLAKEAQPNAYLVKPVKKEDLFASIEIAVSNFSAQAKQADTSSYVIKDAVFIKDKKNLRKILLKDILFLKSENIYVIVHTLKDELIVRSTMQQFIDEIQYDKIVRVNRSYAVNLDHVENVHDETILLKQETIPIQPAYSKELYGRLKMF
jgi:DNA-binding LytR/AlgR family response regulator